MWLSGFMVFHLAANGFFLRFPVNEVTWDKSYRFDNTWKYRLMKNSFFWYFPSNPRAEIQGKLEVLLEPLLLFPEAFHVPNKSIICLFNFFFMFSTKNKIFRGWNRTSSLLPVPWVVFSSLFFSFPSMTWTLLPNKHNFALSLLSPRFWCLQKACNETFWFN